MTFTFYQIAAIVVLHFVFDFVLQSHWMASNKSKNNLALSLHVWVYSFGLGIMGVLFCNTAQQTACWLVFNMVAHFMTDYFTSRASSKLFNKDWHNFFVVVGFDQVLHMLTLFGSMKLIIDYL